ncbi:PaaI family thioesterase [Sulfitobacter sp. D35]|uniref:PaaI family thioesterase n=1 Tax=Sulfitobacter sp. D35 TaxID=3083252 RepID=UPI00296F9606|nr:PaaI family thioesterase [Sulfitobacter sp. D35]MDW4499694.1 PaaI family thioesterase [Sulfitobacter sp. D35]
MTSPPPDAPLSGAHRLIGYDVALDADGSARVSLKIEAKHLNRNDSLHGGIVAMLLDSAAGFAASFYFGGDLLQRVVTVSVTTNFIAAADAGQVVATGTVSGGGHKIAYAAAELRHADGRLLATASSVFKRVAQT